MHRIHASRVAGRCRLRVMNITIKLAVTSNDLLSKVTPLATAEGVLRLAGNVVA